MKKRLLGGGSLLALSCVFTSATFAADDVSNATLADNGGETMQLDDVVVSGSLAF